MRHPLTPVIPPVQSQHIKQNKKVTESKHHRHHDIAKFYLLLPRSHFRPVPSLRLQTAQCLRPERKKPSNPWLHTGIDNLHNISIGFRATRLQTVQWVRREERSNLMLKGSSHFLLGSHNIFDRLPEYVTHTPTLFLSQFRSVEVHG